MCTFMIVTQIVILETWSIEYILVFILDFCHWYLNISLASTQVQFWAHFIFIAELSELGQNVNELTNYYNLKWLTYLYIYQINCIFGNVQKTSY